MSESVAFDRAAGYYDQTRGFPPGVERGVAALIARVGNLTSESRVLEIGIGTGRIALPLAPHVSAYYGVDLARPMLDRMNEKSAGEPIYPVIGDITRLPFASHSFDAVIAVHIFHLVPGYRDALREAARVLKPGGVLLHGWNAGSKATTVEKQIEKIWNETVGALHAPTASAPGAMTRDERLTFLPANSWSLLREDTLTFSSDRPASAYFTGLINRLYSSLWSMPDDIHAAGVKAIQAYVTENQIDLDQPNLIEDGFGVQAFTPPAE